MPNRKVSQTPNTLVEPRLTRSGLRRLATMTAAGGDANLATTPTLLTSECASLSNDIAKQVGALLEVKLAQIFETLDAVSIRLGNIDKRLGGVDKRVEATETRISATEDDVNKLKVRLDTAEKNISALVLKTDDLESRSRCDNIRIFGLKEGIEGRQPIDFFKTWLAEALDLDTKHGAVKLDRAHRTPGAPRGDNKPRVVVVKLHNYADKTKVLAAYKAKQPLIYDGVPVYIRQDLSQGVIQQRRSFNGVCNFLIKNNIRFHMALPATLLFSHGGVKYSFTNAEEAQALLNSWGSKVHSK